jgi:hypothetical protein
MHQTRLSGIVQAGNQQTGVTWQPTFEWLPSVPFGEQIACKDFKMRHGFCVVHSVGELLTFLALIVQLPSSVSAYAWRSSGSGWPRWYDSDRR